MVDARARITAAARAGRRRARQVPNRSPLPSFLIIGAQKAGTTSLLDYLVESGGVAAPLEHEVHYFDHNHERGEAWYRSSFPAARADRVAGESSPFYLLHPEAPRRVAELVPDVKLIALLRNPVGRAYSHFHHSRRFGGEPLSDFDEALAAESERTDAAWETMLRTGQRQPELEWFSYVRRGHYGEQLDRWFAHFPREQFLIMTGEELYKDPSATLARAREHIGVPGTARTDLEFGSRNANSYGPMSDATKQRLGEVFAGDVDRVEEILGRPTGWKL